jgi:hypothetical protein
MVLIRLVFAVPVAIRHMVLTEKVDQRTDRRPVPALVSHWHLDVEVSADPEQFKRVIRGAGDRLGGALICRRQCAEARLQLR